MESILLLISFVTLIVLITSNSSMRREIQVMNNRLQELGELVRLLRKRDVPDTPEEDQPQTQPVAENLPPIAITPQQPDPVPAEPIVPERILEPEVAAVEQAEVVNEVVNVEQVTQPIAEEPSRPPRPGFFERNPDLEKFIGENLANKIGIAILVIGIGFFVKYAIDQDWINEIGRVFIGIAAGGLLLGVAHWLRRRFTAFSSVLVGGGIAVLYLTIAIAFHEYSLFGQTTAFLMMVAITVFAVVFSLAYDRVELAVLSILGGFASPFMVSTGSGNYFVLFTYILILVTGMLVLSYYKKWNLVHIVSFVFTIILFGSWLSVQFDENTPGMTAGALTFATLFYIEFFAMIIINNLKERTPFKAIEFGMLLSNTFLYYSAGMFVLSFPGNFIYRGLFTIALALFNFVFTFLLYRNNKVDRKLVFLLIGLVLTFVSLAAPVQLEGNYITLFWSAETVLLLWLSQRSGIRLMKIGSMVVMVLMIFSLVIDWVKIYEGTADMMPLLNKGWITSMFSVASIFVAIKLYSKESDSLLITPAQYRIALTVIGIVVLYVGNLLELDYQVAGLFADVASRDIAIGCYNMIFILALMVLQKRIHDTPAMSMLFPFWGVLAVLAYLIAYHRSILDARYEYLIGEAGAAGFMLHYVLVLILVGVCALSIVGFRKQPELNASTFNAYSWFYMTFFVILASTELDHVVLLSTYSAGADMYHILDQNRRIGYPILWGLASFILITVGLKWKIRHLRIISLTLFAVTLLKLFIVDIRGISEGGKIAAFISLGVLLLVVSFMYQRLKKLLLTDEPENATK